MSSRSGAQRVEFPYPGLRPFRRHESEIFFGRDEPVDQLLEKLGRSRFLGVVGESGCGKSSLILAGMIPALETGFMASAGARWRVATMRPGNRPVRNLARCLLASGLAGSLGDGEPLDPALVRALDDDEALRRCLDRDEGRFRALRDEEAFLRAALRRGPLGLVEVLGESDLLAGENLLLVVDQFEEIFRFATREDRERDAADKKVDRDEADAFVALLLATAHQDKTRVYVVLTMRSDFLGDCAVFAGLPEALNDSQFLTPRLTLEQRRAAIEGPARVFGGRVQPELVTRLLNDMGSGPDQLPLMQHALMRLWNRAKPPDSDGDGVVLTLDDYEQIGSLTEALSNHADEAYNSLLEEQKRVAQVLFRSLSERETGRRDTRRPARLGDVAAVAGIAPEQVAAVVEAFRRPGLNFLMPPAPEALVPETLLDISHESLIRRWGLMKGWVEAEAASAEKYRRLEQTADLWNKGRAGLLTDPELTEAERWVADERPTAEWAKRYGGDFALFMRFFEASVRNREREQLERQEKRQAEEAAQQRAQELKKFRRMLAMAVAGLIVTLGLGFWANTQRVKAIDAQTLAKDKSDELAVVNGKLIAANKRLALRTEDATKAADLASRSASEVRSLLLAAYSQNSLEKSPQLGLLLAVEAVDSPRHDRTTGLEVPAAEDALRQALSTIGGRGFSGHEGPVITAAISPDGRWLVTGGSDATALLWDLHKADDPALRPYVLGGHQGQVDAALFNPPAVRGEPGREGRWLVTLSSGRGFARLWDLKAKDPSQKPIVLDGHGRPTKLVLSFDGRWLVSVNRAGVQLWDLDLAKDPSARFVDLKLGNIKDSKFWWSLSDNSRWLTVVLSDGTAMLWDLKQSGRSLQPILLADSKPRPYWGVSARPGAPLNVDFSDDSTRLVLLYRDGTVVRWNPMDSKHAETLHLNDDPEERVAIVATDLDGRWCITSSQTGGGPGLPPVPMPPGAPLPKSPPQSRPVPRSAQSTAVPRLWDLTAPKPKPFSLHGWGDEIPCDPSLSPDDRWLAVQYSDGTARLWDIKSQARTTPTILRFQERDLKKLAFSPDGHWLAATGKDNIAHLWNLANLAAQTWYYGSISLRGHDQLVTGVFFSPDSRKLVTSSRDSTARVWDLAPPANPVAQPTSTQSVSWPSALPLSTQRWLPARGADGSWQLWDLYTEDPPARSVPLNYTSKGSDHDLVTGHDGRWLVIYDADSAARLWDLKVEKPAERSFTLTGLKPEFTGLVASPGGRWLVARMGSRGGERPNFQLFDLQSDDPASPSVSIQAPDQKIGTFDGLDRVLVTFNDSEIHVWKLPESKLTTGTVSLSVKDNTDHFVLPAPASNVPITSVVVSPNASRLIAYRWDEVPILWKLPIDSSTVKPMSLDGATGPWSQKVSIVSNDSRRLIAFFSKYYGSDSLQVWDLDAAGPTIQPSEFKRQERSRNRFPVVAVSGDGRWVVNSGLDGGAQLWKLTGALDPTKGLPIRLEGPKSRDGKVRPVSAAAFSGDGRWLVTVSGDAVELWELGQDRPTLAGSVRGYGDPVLGVFVDPERRWLALACGDQAIRLWNMNDGQPDAKPVVLRGGANFTGITRDRSGSRVIATDQNREICVWTLAPERLRELARLVAGRNLHRWESEQFFPDTDYHKTFVELPDPPDLSAPTGAEVGTVR